MAYRDPEDQRRAARAHYLANKTIYSARAAAHRKKTRAAIRELIRRSKDVPCADCGVRYPSYVMQFDHLGEKLFTIGAAVATGKTVQRVADEIAKCDVVCANCHAERTHQRGQRFQDSVEDSADVSVLF